MMRPRDPTRRRGRTAVKRSRRAGRRCSAPRQRSRPPRPRAAGAATLPTSPSNCTSNWATRMDSPCSTTTWLAAPSGQIPRRGTALRAASARPAPRHRAFLSRGTRAQRHRVLPRTAGRSTSSAQSMPTGSGPVPGRKRPRRPGRDHGQPGIHPLSTRRTPTGRHLLPPSPFAYSNAPATGIMRHWSSTTSATATAPLANSAPLEQRGSVP